MSYKYLYEKLEQTKGGATINNLVFIASEALRQKKSEAFSDFMDLDDEEICDVLDWKKEQFVFDKIRDEDESFAYLIFENKQTGFLAECHFSECSNFRFHDDEKEPFAWSVFSGISRVEWIYADSIGELVEKILEKSEQIFKEQVKKEQNKNATSKG